MRRTDSPQVEMQIAPLIDVCFLLLFFFMATAVPNKKEGLIEMPLQRAGSTDESFPPIEEQHVRILESGLVLWNDAALNQSDRTDLRALSDGLSRLRVVAENSNSAVSVIIEAEDKSSYQRLIDVIVACQKSGITSVALASGEPTPQ
jgi:biopolymer transport protein ExbD